MIICAGAEHSFLREDSIYKHVLVYLGIYFKREVRLRVETHTMIRIHKAKNIKEERLRRMGGT